MKTMKFFAAMCCAAIVFAFTGCSKDNAKDIIGSWSLQSTTVTETFNGQSHTETETLEEGESSIYTFNEDNSYSNVITYDGQSYTRTGTYSISGDKLTINTVDFDGEAETYTCTVKIDGNDMTLTFTESQNGFTITEVSSLKRI